MYWVKAEELTWGSSKGSEWTSIGEHQYPEMEAKLYMGVKGSAEEEQTDPFHWAGEVQVILRF